MRFVLFYPFIFEFILWNWMKGWKNRMIVWKSFLRSSLLPFLVLIPTRHNLHRTQSSSRTYNDVTRTKSSPPFPPFISSSSSSIFSPHYPLIHILLLFSEKFFRIKFLKKKNSEANFSKKNVEFYRIFFISIQAC